MEIFDYQDSNVKNNSFQLRIPPKVLRFRLSSCGWNWNKSFKIEINKSSLSWNIRTVKTLMQGIQTNYSLIEKPSTIRKKRFRRRL